MKRTDNLTIGVLAATAAVLALLLVASFLQQPAWAGQPGVKGGDYIMAVGSYNDQTDFLYVIDIAAERLNVYYVNITAGALALGATEDLHRAFQPAAGAP